MFGSKRNSATSLHHDFQGITIENRVSSGKNAAGLLLNAWSDSSKTEMVFCSPPKIPS